MRHLLFRFSVAVVAFIIGVMTATAFAAVFGFGAARERVRQYNYAPPPPPKKMRACPSERLRGLPEPPRPAVPRQQAGAHAESPGLIGVEAR
ncbi:MAG TPA: hypothetical protein VEY09_10660 [Pyrinomonadaceae bacterium]|nr:hypothetical protein [Pyrinomonadaceae bacterium]